MVFAAVTVLALAVQAGSDSLASPFSDSTTERLILRAMETHRQQDTLVTDYQATLRFRLSFSLGNRRWARIPVAAIEEKEAVVTWNYPNDLRVDLLGQRDWARREDFRLRSEMDAPWFFPRGVGDSVAFFGNEFPERAALHPLASDGPDWYDYRLTDSLALFLPDGRELHMMKVEVVPRRTAPALIVGHLWLDRATAQVVRFTFRFVGEGLWAVPDSPDEAADARRANELVNRILSVDADLEYALQEGRYWMPYRQIISGKVEIPLIGGLVVPFEASTTFEDYLINRGTAVVFTVGEEDDEDLDRRRRVTRVSDRNRYEDSTGTVDYRGEWGGGSFQVHRPPADVLQSYAWPDSLTPNDGPEDDVRFREAQGDLARLAEELPSSMTGIRERGVAYERFADVIRFNKVQGLSLGFGYEVKVPGVAFTTANATARYGTSDGRLGGRVSLVRDAPAGRITFSLYREVVEVDRFFRVKTFGNTVNALLTSHDYADYFEATGGQLRYEASLDRGLELGLGVRLENHGTVLRAAGSGLNGLFGDGGFAENPPVVEGPFAVPEVKLSGRSGLADWALGADAYLGSQNTGRLYGNWTQPLPNPRLTLRANLGVATSPTVNQAAFRLGGIRTVRGFPYGAFSGQAFWSVQADLAPWDGEVRPVVFLDAGQVGVLDRWGDAHLRMGAGAGLSFFKGLAAMQLSAPVVNGEGGNLRFDRVFGVPR